MAVTKDHYIRMVGFFWTGCSVLGLPVSLEVGVKGVRGGHHLHLGEFSGFLQSPGRLCRTFLVGTLRESLRPGICPSAQVLDKEAGQRRGPSNFG